MKHIILSIIVSSITCLSCVAKDVPKDSKQFMDFRGKPNFSNSEYAKLYKCQTYEELQKQLIKAIESIAPKKGEEYEDASQINILATCKLALIRVYYLLGKTKEADELLMQLHPVNSSSGAP